MTGTFAQEITLIDIAREGAIGPLRYDLDLSIIGSLLGSPDHWGFHPNEEFFCSWMSFGEVEVGFVAKKNLVKIDYAKFYLSKFIDGRLKFSKIARNKRLYLRNSFSSKRPTFSVVAAAMQKEKIDFKTTVKNFVADETWGIMQFIGNTKFYFSCKEGDVFSIDSSRLSFVAIES
jgi:hypothetical protein